MQPLMVGLIDTGRLMHHILLIASMGLIQPLMHGLVHTNGLVMRPIGWVAPSVLMQALMVGLVHPIWLMLAVGLMEPVSRTMCPIEDIPVPRP